MTPKLHRFVGRGRELAELRDAVSEACSGVGRLCLVTGEPGIGKSRLLEELAREASALALWGRCTEAGGAPAFWPWVQVLRGLLRRADAREAFVRGGRDAHLVTLVPELADRGGELRPPSMEPERARFALLDAVVATLSDAAEQEPLIVLLEDLHAADPASIALLELLAGAVRSARIAVIGTLREPEARRSEAASALARLTREARTLPLARLDRAEVATYLADALGGAADEALIGSVFEATEGHALFLAQIAPRLVRDGAIVIPRGVRDAIRERLAELRPSTREVLETAALLGREVPLDRLAAVHASSIEEAVEEAFDADVWVDGAPGCARFSHVLLVEELERAMDPERRRALHARLGRALEAAGADWASVAHHDAASGERQRALRSCTRAGDAARARFAFEEAAAWYERAMALADAPHERFERVLAAAEARLAGGDLAAGRAGCAEAAALARALGDPERLARAALVRGSIFVFGAVDDALVAALREALDALPPDDAPVRARLMARLAAATQPAPDPEVPIALGREAIAMARRCGEPEPLLETLRSAVSAMMDLGDPRERAPLNREHVRLAEALGRPVEALRGYMRVVFDHYEMGDARSAAEAIDACERIARSIDDPQPRWRVTALMAMRASAEGRFADSEALESRARELATRARDPNAALSLAMLRLGRSQLQGRTEDELAAMPELLALAGGEPLLVTIAHAMHAFALLRAGRPEEARTRLRADAIEQALAAGDLSPAEALVEHALAHDDGALGERLRARLEPRHDGFTAWGMVGLTVGAPAALLLARLAFARGDREQAWVRFEQARARAATLAPYRAWIAWHEARAREAAGMPALAEPLRALAVELANELGIALPEERRAARTPPVPSPRALRMRREGDVWIVEHGERSLAVKDGKGMQMLARLLDEPERELHVLDLSGATGVDGGDAGALIDEQAKQAYRARVRALREEIEEASAWNDEGRRARAEAELEALEHELARALGLGGRTRRTGSASERARVNVQRRLRSAIERIAKADPALGKHLSRSVRTGTFCSYQP